MHKLVGDKIVYAKKRREVQSLFSIMDPKPCQVTMTLGPDGPTDVDCTNNSCTKTCNLKQRETDDTIEYWCDCE